jgi:hypothetical protein
VRRGPLEPQCAARPRIRRPVGVTLHSTRPCEETRAGRFSPSVGQTDIGVGMRFTRHRAEPDAHKKQLQAASQSIRATVAHCRKTVLEPRVSGRVSPGRDSAQAGSFAVHLRTRPRCRRPFLPLPTGKRAGVLLRRRWRAARRVRTARAVMLLSVDAGVLREIRRWPITKPCAYLYGSCGQVHRYSRKRLRLPLTLQPRPMLDENNTNLPAGCLMKRLHEGAVRHTVR